MAKNVNKGQSSSGGKKVDGEKNEKDRKDGGGNKEKIKGFHHVLIARRLYILKSIVSIDLECNVEFANSLAIFTRCVRIRVNY